MTICTQGRQEIFGEIIDGEMCMNEYGEIVEKCWLDLPNHYSNIELDVYMIMPDHFHGIITVGDKGNISEIMRDFKSYASYEINNVIGSKGKFWQEDFYEHCIRNEKDFEEKLNYIHWNPVRANLVKEPCDYYYSSCNNYFLDDHSIVKIDLS